MGELILPMLAEVLLFGSTLHLAKYELMPFQIYDNSNINQITQILSENFSNAEYRLLTSPVEFRKFLDLDIATALKAAISDFRYEFRRKLYSYTGIPSEDHVEIAVKINLRTVNESVPLDSVTIGDWETKGPQHVGSHFVHSIVYGADVFTVFTIYARSKQHRNSIRRSILASLGEAGDFDSSFKEKFDQVLKEQETSYGMTSYGTLFSGQNISPGNVDQLLALKDQLPEMVKSTNNGKGEPILYQMKPLSLLSSKFPLVQVDSQIIEKLREVELKYEDIVIAQAEYTNWLNNISPYISEEDETKVGEFDDAIYAARLALETAIHGMDITTSGSVDQFEYALTVYGGPEDTRYRHWLNTLRQQIPTKDS